MHSNLACTRKWIGLLGSRISTLFAMVVIVALTVACGDNADQVSEPTVVPKELTPIAEPENNIPLTDSLRLDSDGDGLLTSSEYREAVSLGIRAYDWPPKYQPDVEKIVPSDSTGMFEPGVEHSQLEVLNECAWNQTWVDARQSNDAETEARALQVMTEVLPKRPGLDSITIDWITESAAKAALGDPSMVQQFITANCKFDWTVDD